MASPALPLPARILIVDDHLILQEGIRALLSGHREEMEVVGCAGDARTSLCLVDELKPDLVLLDFYLGQDIDGVLLIRQILERHRKARILVFSLNREQDLALRVLKEGAFGYLMKVEGIAKLLEALRTVARGQRYVSDAVLGEIVDGPNMPSTPPENSPFACLSPRELQIFHLLGAGLPLPTIAERLFISARTVASHRESLKNKLNCQTSADLTRVAKDWIRHQGRGPHASLAS